MRCHYVSDLHLESQDFSGSLPGGDVLIIAGDLCHARCLDAPPADKYAADQRDRVMRFIDDALARFAHVLLVVGNHDHYDGVFDDTAALFKSRLPGVRVLDSEAIELNGVRFFGTTLWTDYEGRSEASLNGVRRRCGEFFFVKKRHRDAEGTETIRKFQPEDALAAFDASVKALQDCLAAASGKKMVVVSHHPPSPKGLNPEHAGNGLDGAYASDLDAMIEAMNDMPVWVHGHTHIRRTYRIGGTTLRANCRGFEGKDLSARGFAADMFFEL